MVPSTPESPALRLLSHADLRVRDRRTAEAFYDALLAALGARRHSGPQWSVYAIVPAEVGPDTRWIPSEWLSFTEDPAMVAGSTRLAFRAPNRERVDRIAALLPQIGAREIEGPEDAVYGPGFYAVFFRDPDGNRLEVAAYAPVDSGRTAE
jgi:catechol 2,3-dioxygenase-like lactoylglutathione lyase family enzyme